MDRLGVQRSTVALFEGDQRLEPEATELAVWEWTINGESLSEMFDGDTFVPLLYDHSVDLRDALLRLRGDITDPPVFTPRYERTFLDRLLRRKGTPWAFSGSAYEDGRVCLLQCPCGDLDCAALTAQVVISDRTVEWKDIGWQVTYEPFMDYNETLRSATFDRAEYIALIDELLEKDWTQVG